jgi:RimJ/RimL family protein N-acetyltransferase
MARPPSTRPRTTRRLQLRPFRRRDADALVAGVRDSLDELATWLPWAHRRYGRPDAVRFIRDSIASWAEGRAFDFAIRGHGDGHTHLGNVSVWHTSRREEAGEIGYWVRSTRTGEGIATEAAARIIQMAFEELSLHRVTLRIAAGNVGSERVAEKLGFTREGLLRKEVLVAGEWLDHSLWGFLEDEYRANLDRYREAGWLGGRR